MSTRGDRGDAQLEATVLEMILARHPAQLTVIELARELGAAPERSSDRLDVDRAIGALVESGLLHRQGDLVLPTPAALHFDRLLGG